MAHGMEIQWLQYGSNCPDMRGANGCYSAQKILAKLKIDNKHPDKKTAYAYVILWSDSFLKSWVKQKGNSIWILTVTLPIIGKNATSPFRTHCLAIGRALYDHTAVIDYYLNEIVSMRNGTS